METIRKAAVAGRFYPAQAEELRQMLRHYLEEAKTDAAFPKAIIAPHAGYPYSGPIAASAYAPLMTDTARQRIQRVVLLGPSHYVALPGMALSSATTFETPLGNIPVDQTAVQQLLTLPQVRILDEAHAREHSLEVHLPFLQIVLGSFSLVPLTVGQAAPSEVTAVLELLANDEETLIVVSSDLSHFQTYETARRIDRTTSQAIERLEPETIESGQACGRIAIQGLLHFARRHGLTARTIDLRNSGDTAGPRDKVVGYGAYLFYRSSA